MAVHHCATLFSCRKRNTKPVGFFRIVGTLGRFTFMIRKRVKRRILAVIAIAICIGIYSVAAHHRYPHVVGVSYVNSEANAWSVDVKVLNPTDETVAVDIEVSNRVAARTPTTVDYSQGHATTILQPGERRSVRVSLKQRPAQYSARISNRRTVDVEPGAFASDSCSSCP